MTLHQKARLLTAPSSADLVLICEALNSQQSSSERLRQLVTDWRKSGPNLQKMMSADTALGVRLRTACKVDYRGTSSGRADLELCIDPLAFEIQFTTGIVELSRSPERTKQRLMKMQVEQEAIRLFLLLTLNPAWEKLGGPCARCGRYYVKKRRSQKVYCSRRCGNSATAILRTLEQRKQERKTKLVLARKVARQWRSKSGMEWKKFMSERTGLTVKWLTRAVNHGELRAPSNISRLR